MKKEIKIALIGAKFAANLHYQAYKHVPGVDINITGITSKTVESAKTFCARHGLDTSIVYDNADVMIEEVDADIIDLVVPTFLHVPYAIKAAKEGKSVICEKPLTGYFGDHSVSIEERIEVGNIDKKIMLQECIKDCERLKTAFDKSDSIFCYAENWVYAPSIVKAKKLLKAAHGKILEIRCGEGHSGSHSPFASQWKYTGGGSLVRQAAHPYGAAIHLKMWEGFQRDGKPIYPQSVIATTTKCRDLLKEVPEGQDHIKSRPIDVEDWSCGIISFEDGTAAVVIGSDITLGGIENWFYIYGSNTRIECNLSKHTGVMAYAPSEKQFENAYTIEKTETKAGWSYAQPDEEWSLGYPFEIRDFINCVLEKKSPESNMDLAIWTTKVMYAAYLSAETGQRINIPKAFVV